MRGEFPTQAEDALISLAWLLAAQGREAVDNEDKVHAGIDVAEAGEDETVLAIRQGSNLLQLKTWHGIDARGPVAAAMAPYRGRLDCVNVDTIGVGFYFARHLKDLGYRIASINVSKKSGDTEKYANFKAELYWGLRMRFEQRDVAGLTDERALGQLATIRYTYNPRGQLVIESKEDARQRGIKSPDRAEAIMLAFAAPRGPGMYELMRQQYEKFQAKQAAAPGARPSGWSDLLAQTGRPVAAQTDDDDPSARYTALAAKLLAAHRADHYIADLDPDHYKSYLRPRLLAFPDPAAATLITELDRRFGLA